MNPFIMIVIYLVIDIIVFKILGIWVGLIGLTLILYETIRVLGITRSLSIGKGSFIEGDVFTKDYVGSYSKNHQAFLDALAITKSFNLKDYSIIAIYYDAPGVTEESKLRASIGIYRKATIDNKNKKIPEDLERYCKEKGYKYNKLPNSSSLYSFWNYSNIFSMMIGIKKYYSMMEPKMTDPYFQRQYRFKERDIKVGIEVYDEDKIHFYTPLFNSDKFLIFTKDK